MDKPSGAVDLPSGGWVLERDFKIRKLTQGEREDTQALFFDLSSEVLEIMNEATPDDPDELKDYERRMIAATNPADGRAMQAMQRGLTALTIDSWSFDPPVSAAALRDLTAEDVDVINQISFGTKDIVLGTTDFTATKPGVESPTEPVSV